jgi:hypothetical protein
MIKIFSLYLSFRVTTSCYDSLRPPAYICSKAKDPVLIPAVIKKFCLNQSILPPVQSNDDHPQCNANTMRRINNERLPHKKKKKGKKQLLFIKPPLSKAKKSKFPKNRKTYKGKQKQGPRGYSRNSQCLGPNNEERKGEKKNSCVGVYIGTKAQMLLACENS